MKTVRRVLAPVVVVALVSGVAACSSQAVGNDSGTGGDTGPRTDGAAGNDVAPVTDGGDGASSADGSSHGDAGADAATANGLGRVNITRLPDGTTTKTTVSASFRTGAQPGDACPTFTSGACVVTGCHGAAQGTPGTAVSAGNLSITGGSAAITVMPEPTYFYYDYSSGFPSGGATVEGGNALTIMTDGAIAPAFMANVTVPEDITLTAPTESSPGHVTVSRTMDLPLAWTGGVSGNVMFILYQRPMGLADYTSVVCSFPASAGSGTVPAEALGALTVTDAELEAFTSLVIVPIADVTAAPTGWQIAIEAQGTGFLGNASVQ